MRPPAWSGALASVVLAFAMVGCGGKRIEGSVFHSSKGFRVAIPGADWTVVLDSRADLELRHRAARSGMLANAVCEGRFPREPLPVLARHLLVGFRDRTVVERGEVSLNGRRTAHTVLEGRTVEGEARVKVEAYVMKDHRCVYDLLYVAPASAFETWRDDFRRFTETFSTE